jgi:hypothetical protein
MKSRERFKSAIKYTFYNSFVLLECYEIVNRVRNRSQKNGVEGKKEGLKRIWLSVVRRVNMGEVVLS